jgi:hypothetical protein
MEKATTKSTFENLSALPNVLKIAILYFSIVGLYYFYMSVTDSWPFQTKPQVWSQAFFIASSVRRILCILFIVPGIGLIYKKKWAISTSLVLIVANTIYQIIMSSWVFSTYDPPLLCFLGIAVIVMWNGLWFHLLSKKSFKEALN